MNNIRISCLKGALPFVALMALSFSSCGNKKISSENTGTNTETDKSASILKTDSISWNDSIATPAGNKAYCRISVAYPVDGNARLLDSIRHWIAGQLSTNSFISHDTVKPFTVPGADLADGEKYIKNVGTHVLDKAKPELLGLDSLRIEPGMAYEYDWNISDIYQTDKFVTYASSTYCYLGGAHGGSSFTPQVFSLTDGREFGWDMFRTDSIPALKNIIRQALMTQHFEVKTEAELRDCLLINPDTLPLPVTPPYFTADGVHFVYQQYEIAPYAAGMPGCVLPYGKMRPMLTEAAAALLPAK